MKTTIYYIAAGMLLFTACSNSDDDAPAYADDALAVHFNVSLGASQTRAELTNTGDLLAEGTAVGITRNAGSDYYTYLSDAEGNLTPETSDFIHWTSITERSVSILAYIPVTEGTTANAFTLPTDQSDGITPADFATFAGTVSRTTTDAYASTFNNASFTLLHRLSQVKVIISEQDEKYADCTFRMTFYSPSSAVTADYTNGTATIEGNGNLVRVTPQSGLTDEGKTYATAILTPGTADAAVAFIELQAVNAAGDEVGTPMLVLGQPTLESGVSYTFRLKAINDAIDVASVDVTDWQEGATLTADIEASLK